MRRFLGVFVLFLSVSAFGAEQKKPIAETPLVAEPIRQALQDRKYAEALAAIAEAEKAKDAPREYLAWLRGRTLTLLGRCDEAVAEFDRLEKEYPKGDWGRSARFAKAIALARKGDFRAAETIYRAEAEHLLSVERKQQIADIYLEFADLYFKPPKDDQKPDFAKALEFFKKAIEVGPKPEKRIEVELSMAQCLQKLNKLDEAIAGYEKFIKDYPKHALDPDARYALGQCRLAKGDRKEARRVWQDLLAKYPDARSDRFAEAAFGLAATWQIPKPTSNEELSAGIAALDAFIERFPDHKLASRAHLEAAVSYLNFGRHEDAVAALDRFLKNPRYAQREEIPEARALLGNAYQAQKKYTEAIAVWHDYLAKHPAHKMWSQVQAQIVATEYLIGREKFDTKQYEAARKIWTDFLAKYPLDARHAATLFLFGEMNYRQDKWAEAIDDWRRLTSKFPESGEAVKARLRIAATLEQKLGKLEEALEEYRKMADGKTPGGDPSGEARAAVARLTAKTLSIATERVCRTGETPTIRLTSRNIETVTVRAYSIDMETYFRKMHLAEGVEQLDIALIDPDKTFEYKIPNYVKHQELERSIEIPIPEKATSDVMAVTVSSATLEATTLVVRSDLDILVKSSRDEAFVFAENMKTGKPWPGVKLLISDGKKVFAEGKTGDDGVFRKEFKELRDAADVRVFALEGRNSASNRVSLEGVQPGRGLSDKGFIYTDRPAYRAGQLVNVRGCIRRVKRSADGIAADAYEIEAGKKFTLEAFDARNRLVGQEKVAIGPFGTFHAHFTLPEGSPQGQYRVLLRDDAGQNYQGTFTVQEYQLDPVQLAIDSPRSVYYRGEEIEGVIRASFYYGAPLAGREIRYQLAGERLHTATTDAKGEVKFKLPTRDFSESQTLPLVVILPERNLQTAQNFRLAAQGFSIEVETVRPVYVGGETFEATATVRDAEGKPLAEKLTLRVLERTTVEGRVGERLVEEHKLETAKDDGKVRKTLKLEKGGRYILRAEGIDRFKNPITGQSLVQISDADDAVRLRILADRHTFKAGETAKIRLHWREEPALAVITFQGARVLDYRLVSLAKGENVIDAPMTAALAPNFELAAAVMTDAKTKTKEGKLPQRLHLASSSFTVERDLRVAIAWKPKQGTAARPGQPIEVSVTTTDANGKPVAAELSLAMVEQSLLTRFPDPTGSIGAFFRGAMRQPSVRTTASVTFRYEPSTRPIDPQLLAESDRLEVTKMETESLRRDTAGRRMSHRLGDARAADEPATADPNAAASDQIVQEESQSALMLDLNGANTFSGTAVVTGGVLVTNGAARGSYGLAVPQQQLGGQAGEVRQRIMHGNGVQAYGGVALKKNGKRDESKSQAQGFVATDGDGDRSAAWGYYFTTPTQENLQQAVAKSGAGVLILSNSGVISSTIVPATGKEFADFSERLKESGSLLVMGALAEETGYWNPAVVTDANGRATIEINLPDRSTAWKISAKGITVDTLAGDAAADVTVKKELFGELKLPMAFTEGDEARVLATIHNDAVEKGSIEVVLKTTIGGLAVEERKKLAVSAKGMMETSFAVSLRRPEAKPTDPTVAGPAPVAFELTVTSGERSDTTRRTVPLNPFGMPVFAVASGTASSDATAWVELPNTMPTTGPSLQILIGPTVARSMLDVVLGAAPFCQIETARIASGLETTTSDLMAALAVQKLLGESRDAVGPQAQSLDGRVRASIGLLVSSQNDDGGWSWTLGNKTSNRVTSARVVWALALARGAGYKVPDDGFGKALNYLRAQTAAAANSDYDTKAVLLHALSVAGQGDFALANRLHRDRQALSANALLATALSLVEMDRKTMAGELLTLAAERLGNEKPAAAAPKALPWGDSPVELRALYALAVQKVLPDSPKAKESAEWLLAHRTGHRWSPDKATGPATMSVALWLGKTQRAAEHYKLAVFVNDVRAKELEIDGAANTQTIDVPVGMLKAGKQRVNFQVTGRAQFAYQCILSGFVPGDQIKSTQRNGWIHRYYQPAPLELDGQEIPRGFDVLAGSYTTFRNAMTQLPQGKRTVVDLDLQRHNYAETLPDDQYEYLVVQAPIPGGMAPIESSFSGAYERFEVSPGMITFYVGNRRYIGNIHYELHGYLPGEYRSMPAIVRNAYRPDLFAATPIEKNAKPLAVLEPGKASADEYRLTPRELFELGKRHFAKNDYKTAQKHLEELTAKWELNPDVYKQSVQMLLDAHLELGPPAKIVHYFEIIKEKWPAEEVPFAKIVRVGAAYHELGEYERAYLVFRATVESSFLRESGVAGFLETQGEFMRSVDVMARLLREYPAEPYNAAATVALAQNIYAKAPKAAEDQKLRQAKINRVDLIRMAWRSLESFMAAFPDDPAADQAAFAAANALLELKQFDQAAAACDRYAVRYPKSDLLDSYWYIIGYCHYATGRHQQALEMCRKVAEAKRVDKNTGASVESANKWRAIYILGQIYHSLGQAANAIREYRIVESRFADAKEAIQYFLRKSIELPEVTTVRPGKPAEVELKFRNVASCDLKVYRIDLMKFSLLKRNLGGITQINLSGIRPYHEAAVALGEGKDYRDRTQMLNLPLKDEGAYLVVCRGDELHASGLVLVTPLALEVQEDAASGRVRTTVKDAQADRYLNDVHVKVIGSGNGEFISGETDLRGVFVSDGIRGRSTVIAQVQPSRYAFFRGQTELGPPPATPAEQTAAEADKKPAAAAAQPASPAKAKGEKQADLLQGLQMMNRAYQEKQVEQLNKMYQAPVKGVEAQRAY